MALNFFLSALVCVNAYIGLVFLYNQSDTNKCLRSIVKLEKQQASESTNLTLISGFQYSLEEMDKRLNNAVQNLCTNDQNLQAILNQHKMEIDRIKAFLQKHSQKKQARMTNDELDS